MKCVSSICLQTCLFVSSCMIQFHPYLQCYTNNVIAFKLVRNTEGLLSMDKCQTDRKWMSQLEVPILALAFAQCICTCIQELDSNVRYNCMLNFFVISSYIQVQNQSWKVLSKLPRCYFLAILDKLSTRFCRDTYSEVLKMTGH